MVFPSYRFPSALALRELFAFRAGRPYSCPKLAASLYRLFLSCLSRKLATQVRRSLGARDIGDTSEALSSLRRFPCYSGIEFLSAVVVAAESRFRVLFIVHKYVRNKPLGVARKHNFNRNHARSFVIVILRGVKKGRKLSLL